MIGMQMGAETDTPTPDGGTETAETTVEETAIDRLHLPLRPKRIHPPLLQWRMKN